MGLADSPPLPLNQSSSSIAPSSRHVRSLSSVGDFFKESFSTRLALTSLAVNLTDCVFVACRASGSSSLNLADGGAVFLWSSVTFAARGCRFRRNEAVRSGGAVRVRCLRSVDVSDCLFDRNTATKSCGAVSFLSVNSSSVRDTNLSTNGWCHQISSIGLTSCVISGLVRLVLFRNSARLNGAIAPSNGKCLLNESLFYNNSATVCSALFIRQAAIVTVTRCVFMDRCGPSVSLTDRDSVTLRGCRFARDRKAEITALGRVTDEQSVFNNVVEFRPDDAGGPAPAAPFEEEEPATKTRKPPAVMIIAYGAALVALSIGVAKFLARKKKRVPTSDEEKLVGGHTYREPD